MELEKLQQANTIVITCTQDPPMEAKISEGKCKANFCIVSTYLPQDIYLLIPKGR